MSSRTDIWPETKANLWAQAVHLPCAPLGPIVKIFCEVDPSFKFKGLLLKKVVEGRRSCSSFGFNPEA